MYCYQGRISIVHFCKYGLYFHENLLICNGASLSKCITSCLPHSCAIENIAYHNVGLYHELVLTIALEGRS